MTANGRSRQPVWVMGRVLLSGWIVVTSLALISGAHGRPYFLVVGVFSIAVVVVLAVRLVARLAHSGGSTREPSERNDPLFHTSPPLMPLTPLQRLRQHDAAVADQVQVSLDLLTGPLVAVLALDDTRRARRAVESALTEYATIQDAIDRTVAAQLALSTTLTSADLDAGHDADAQHLVAHEADLRRRRDEEVTRLQRSAAGLQTAWVPVRDQQLLGLRRGQISRARDQAEQVAAQVVPSADAAAGLTDAVEEIQGSLGGVGEIAGINDRILGDSYVTTTDPTSTATDGSAR